MEDLEDRSSLLSGCTQSVSVLIYFFILETFKNSRMLPNLKQARKKPVPNAGTKSRPERGCSQMLGAGNFLDFLGKNPVPGKWHSGT